MNEEKKITSQFDSDPLLKLKSREVDLRAMENERKKDNDQAQIDLARARLMQQGDIAEDKMEQNEDLAKLRAGVSLAKTGIDQAKVMIDVNYAIEQKRQKNYEIYEETVRKKEG